MITASNQGLYYLFLFFQFSSEKINGFTSTGFFNCFFVSKMFKKIRKEPKNTKEEKKELCI
tara:strand:- start:1091 stop:1273 length:183 start_codon:yes stop_codon:yes gene_type:complete